MAQTTQFGTISQPNRQPFTCIHSERVPFELQSQQIGRFQTINLILGRLTQIS